MAGGPVRPGPPVGPDQLEAAWRRGELVALAGPQEQPALAQALGAGGVGQLQRLAERWGPGVVLGSGGSSGRRRWCLQPLAHLEASAAATGLWLQAIGLDPAACVHLNPLPTHHVSGLLPWLRSRRWGCAHRPIPPALMRQPQALAAQLPIAPQSLVLLSLVPTQLARLLADPAGLAWLQRLALIWVGGAPLPPALAQQARQAGLRLAPCYGTTETAAMVTALNPEAFLAGIFGCGPPLEGVELRLAAKGGALEVRCARLSPGYVGDGALQPLPQAPGGWWRSGDAGRLSGDGLQLLGRLDGAIHSGGETVFPEQLEGRLRALAASQGLPLGEVLLLGVDDPLWGQRLVALVRAQPTAKDEELVAQLQAAVADWPPAERPRTWLPCPTLAPTALGKWPRARWQRWLESLEAGDDPSTCPPRNDHPE